MRIIFHFILIIFLCILLVKYCDSAHTKNYSLTFRNLKFDISYRPFILDDASNTDEFPGMCYHWDTKHPWPPGGTYKYKHGDCLSFYCSRPGSVIVRDCGTIKAPSNCKEICANLNRLYPYCCKRYLCKDEINGIDFIVNPMAGKNEN